MVSLGREGVSWGQSVGGVLGSRLLVRVTRNTLQLIGESCFPMVMHPFQVTI